AVQEGVELGVIHPGFACCCEKGLHRGERFPVRAELPGREEVVETACHRDGEKLTSSSANLNTCGVGAEARGQPGSGEGVRVHSIRVELRAARGTSRPCRGLSLTHQTAAVAGCGA